MDCVKHESVEATGTCTYCGKFFCADCLVDVKGRNYCREHVGNAVEEQTASTVQPNITINNANANTNTNKNTNMNGFGISISPKSRLISLLLCIFLGFFGGHRFYAGKIGSGVLYLFTLGFAGIGVFIDLFYIIFGGFRDSYGMPIKRW